MLFKIKCQMYKKCVFFRYLINSKLYRENSYKKLKVIVKIEILCKDVFTLLINLPYMLIIFLRVSCVAFASCSSGCSIPVHCSEKLDESSISALMSEV